MTSSYGGKFVIFLNPS